MSCWRVCCCGQSLILHRFEHINVCRAQNLTDVTSSGALWCLVSCQGIQTDNLGITEANNHPPELQQVWRLKPWLLLHQWKQQQKQILGFCWLGQWVLIIRSFHSRWKSIHGSGPSHSGHQYITGHTPSISTRGNLEPICVMQTVGIQSIQMRHPHKDIPHTTNPLRTLSLVIYRSVYGANVNVYSQSNACAYIRNILISSGCAHMN